jgi:hypothetical protein
MPLTSAEEFGAETLVCGAHKARLSSPRPEQEDLSVRCATIHRPINGSPIHEFSKDQEKKTGEDDNAVLIWRRDYHVVGHCTQRRLVADQNVLFSEEILP